MRRDPVLFSDVFLKMQELKKNNDNFTTSKIILDLKESLMKDNDFFLGNPKGEKVIGEFFDYNCGYCKRNFTELIIDCLTDRDIFYFFVYLIVMNVIYFFFTLFVLP